VSHSSPGTGTLTGRCHLHCRGGTFQCCPCTAHSPLSASDTSGPTGVWFLGSARLAVMCVGEGLWHYLNLQQCTALSVCSPVTVLLLGQK